LTLYTNVFISGPSESTDIYLHTAIHEASHAVTGYYFGWWIGDEGVRIEPDGYAGLKARGYDCTLEADCCVFLAGWLAETLLNPIRAHRRTDEDLNHVYEFSEFENEGSDDECVLKALRSENPEMDLPEFIAAYRAYEHRTLELLARPIIWQTIVRIAEALIQEGRLSQEEVEVLIPDEIIRGVWRRDT
jgi:hypothetical protein